MWAVQFCPPAPLGNTGLASSGHKSFFCFFILPLPTLSPHRGIGPHLSAFPALSSHAFTHLPCIRKDSPLNLFPYPPQERLGKTFPGVGARLPPHLFACRVLAIFRATALCFECTLKCRPARSGCPVREAYRIRRAWPLALFRSASRLSPYEKAARRIRRTASPRVSDARGMEEDAPPRKQTAAGRGKGTEERFRSLREGKPSPFQRPLFALSKPRRRYRPAGAVPPERLPARPRTCGDSRQRAACSRGNSRTGRP